MKEALLKKNEESDKKNQEGQPKEQTQESGCTKLGSSKEKCDEAEKEINGDSIENIETNHVKDTETDEIYKKTKQI